MKDLVSFGQWLKQQRLARDLTQKQLADILSCSPSTIRKLEAGVRRPSRQLAEQLAKNFDLPLDSIQSLIQSARTHSPGEQPDTALSTLPRHHADLSAQLTSFVKSEQEVAAALTRLELEYENVRAALKRVVGSEDPDLELGIGSSLMGFRDGYGYLSEKRQRLESTSAQTGNQFTHIRARALHLAGALARAQADYDQAQMLHEQSLMLYEILGDERGVASELDHLAWVALSRGDYEQSADHASESLSIFRRLGDKRGIANSLNHLGWIALERSDHNRARSSYQESLVLAQELQDKYACTRALNNLGEVARSQKDYKQARILYNQSLALAQEIEHEQGVAAALHNLGYVALRENNPNQARSFFEDSLKLFQKLGDKQGVVECLAGLGGASVLEGSPTLAVQLLAAANALLEALGSPFQPTDRIEYDFNLNAAHVSLDAETFKKAWKAGIEMTAEQAIASASKLVETTTSS